MMNESKLRSALIEALGSDVVSCPEIGRRLTAAGLRVPESAIRQHIQWDTSFVELADGIASVPAIIDGVAFGAPVTQDDADAGYIATHPWFDVFSWWLIGSDDIGGVELLDRSGEPLGRIDTDGLMIDGVDTDVIVGPGGWLDPHVGRWMALRADAGSLVIEPLDDRPARPSTADGESVGVNSALRTAFDRIAERQQFRSANGEDWSIARAPISDVFIEAITVDRSLFTGATLVIDDEFLESAGLRIDRHVVVPTSVDADLLQAATREQIMVARFGVTPSETGDVSTVLDALERFGAGDPDAFGDDPEERSQAMLDMIATGEAGDGPIDQAHLDWADAVLDRQGVDR